MARKAWREWRNPLFSLIYLDVSSWLQHDAEQKRKRADFSPRFRWKGWKKKEKTTPLLSLNAPRNLRIKPQKETHLETPPPLNSREIRKRTDCFCRVFSTNFSTNFRFINVFCTVLTILLLSFPHSQQVPYVRDQNGYLVIFIEYNFKNLPHF